MKEFDNLMLFAPNSLMKASHHRPVGLEPCPEPGGGFRASRLRGFATAALLIGNWNIL